MIRTTTHWICWPKLRFCEEKIRWGRSTTLFSEFFYVSKTLEVSTKFWSNYFCISLSYQLMKGTREVHKSELTDSDQTYRRRFSAKGITCLRKGKRIDIFSEGLTRALSFVPSTNGLNSVSPASVIGLLLSQCQCYVEVRMEMIGYYNYLSTLS